MSDGGGGGATEGPVRLLRLMVFNPSFGPREGEEEKRTVFYHPPEDDSKAKIRNIGFVGACTTFPYTFFKDKDCKSVHTQKTKTVLLQPEPGHWLALTVALPFCGKKRSNGKGEVQYSPEDVHDSVLQAMLQHSYDMFRFFMGTFESLLLSEDGDVDSFKARVASFFSKFVHTMKPAQASIYELFRAIQFLTLESGAFLRVQGFVNRIEDEFPQVSKVVFFQQGNVVWTELQQDDTRLLYYYITSSLLPSTAFAAATAAQESPRSPFSGHQGRFLAGGPASLRGDGDCKVLKVHLDDCGERVEHHLIVYHAVSSTVCLLVPAIADLTQEFFRMLDAIMGPHLTNMSADLLDVFAYHGSSNKLTPSVSIPRSLSSVALDSSPSVRYIYFNKFNCAMKSTLQVNGDSSLNPDVIKMMLDLSENFEKARDKVSGLPMEAFVKMHNEQWVIGKSADQRQVFVVITSKCATLMDASEEVDRLLAAEFKNVFLLEN